MKFPKVIPVSSVLGLLQAHESSKQLPIPLYVLP